MSTNQNQVSELINTKFGEFEARLNGEKKSELHTARRSAFSKLSDLGLPVKKDEEYKYSNVSRALEKHLEDFTVNPEINIDTIAGQLPTDLSPTYYVFVNGKYEEGLSRPASQKGLEILTLSEAFDKYADKINDLSAENASKPDAFNFMNHAFTGSGLYIEASKGTLVEHPIVLINVSDSRAGKVLASPRHVAFIAENAQATLADINISLGDEPTFSNTSLEIDIASKAVFNLYALTKEPEHAIKVNNTYIRQAADSVMNSVTIDFSGKLIRNNLRIDLDGEHCESNLSGLYMPAGKSHVDNHTTVDHKVPNCNSNELYKGILDDESTGVFNGKIFVRQDAQKTNAFQSNKNILLTDDATVNTKPQLEIWADDVKCSHGCTTGQLDEDQLFYLRARAIGADKARAMLLHAFAEEVIEKIKSEPIKKYLESLLNERIDIE